MEIAVLYGTFLCQSTIPYSKDAFPDHNETFMDWTDRYSERRKDLTALWDETRSLLIKDKKVAPPPWKLNSINFPALSPSIRFPLPPLLEKFLPWQNDKRRGRPREWGPNILICELSRFMADSDIADLFWPKQKPKPTWDKTDRRLSRISTIKKKMEEIIATAYPFSPQST
jgi:hypothetical protein